VNLPVLCAHALDTSANANLDHTGTDLVSDVDAGLQARGALAVEGADSRRFGETGYEGSGAHLGGATAGRQDLANAYIFYERGVDAGACDYTLQCAGHQVRCLCILEGALAALGEGRSQAGGHDDLDGKIC